MPHVPQNGEEAAYVSFALVDALIDALAAKGFVDRHVIASGAIKRIRQGTTLVEHSTQGKFDRAADFIRDTMLGQK